MGVHLSPAPRARWPSDRRTSRSRLGSAAQRVAAGRVAGAPRKGSSYPFPGLGICGTYISFLAGNIPNFRLPVSAVAREVVGVQEGSPEGEIVSTLAIAATQLMLTLSALTGAIFVSAIVGLLPASVVAAFDWLLPSIWGAIVVQFGLRNWRHAAVAVIVSIVVVVYSGLPGWSHTPILVVSMVALALFTYRTRATSPVRSST